jgi:hypothetical protein
MKIFKSKIKEHGTPLNASLPARGALDYVGNYDRGLSFFNTVHRANGHAVRRIVMPHTLNARFRVDLIDHIAFEDRLGGALGLAGTA